MRRRTRAEGADTGAVPLGELLARYRVRLRPPQGVVIEAFRAVVEAELGIELAPAQVRYSVYTQTVSVTASGPEKSEISFHKKRILALCTDVLGKQNAPKHIL